MTLQKAKARDKRLMKKYGITLVTYNLMLERQGGNCAMCGKHQSNFKVSLHVDHNHKSKKVRGLVCFHCNHQLIRRHNMKSALRLVEYFLKFDP